MCDNNVSVLDADFYDLADFGVMKFGGFDTDGFPVNSTIDINVLSEKLPRWCKPQPVIYLSLGVDQSVYLRGMYSTRLSKLRRAAKYGHTHNGG